jgi:hypothetical protein
MVGLTGFEPATPCPPDKCATKLRYSPLFAKAPREAGLRPCSCFLDNFRLSLLEQAGGLRSWDDFWTVLLGDPEINSAARW